MTVIRHTRTSAEDSEATDLLRDFDRIVDRLGALGLDVLKLRGYVLAEDDEAMEDAEREQARYYAMREDRDRLQALLDAHKGFLRDALNRLGGP